ncbi:hypothetical protein [Duganella sp. S19_KUP01_CR8]|uniref:hypothetical protein n=1 Tax=Duganella sp. S19_KUP01_CR8 TaxID=3025502 RepID=UPI002FCDA117
MGRILSGGVNSSVTGGGTLQNLSTVTVAGEAVVQGQLACVGVDGLAYYALDPAGPGGALRPLSGAIPPATPCAAGVSFALAGSANSHGTGCTLSNGNAVMVGSNGSTLQVGIYNPLGAQQGGYITLPHAQPSISTYAVALSGGGFALAYQDLGTQYATVAVFSSSGTQILAPSIVEAGVATSSLAIAPLSGGGFAVAYCTSAGAVRYAVYSATGTVVQAPAATGLVGVLTASPCAVSVCGLSSGGFVVAAMVFNQISTYFSRFNAAGVAQQTAINLNNAGGTSNPYGSVCTVGLAGGGFIIVHHYGASVSATITTLSAAGSVVGAQYSSGATGSNYFPGCAAVARSDGSAVVATPGSVFIANSNGTIGVQFATTIPHTTVVTQADNGWIVVGGYGANLEVRDSSLNSLATLQYANLGLFSGQLNAAPICLLPVGRSPVRSAAPLVLALTPGSAGARFASIALTGVTGQKTTPIGVFGASAAAGSAVPVQYQGVATLAGGFVQPFTIDANSASPPGQRMAVVGNQAMLSGIQPPQNRRQIN